VHLEGDLAFSPWLGFYQLTDQYGPLADFSSAGQYRQSPSVRCLAKNSSPTLPITTARAISRNRVWHSIFPPGSGCAPGAAGTTIKSAAMSRRRNLRDTEVIRYRHLGLRKGSVTSYS